MSTINVSKEDKTIAQIVSSRYSHLKTSQEEIFDEVETYHQMWRAAMTEDQSYPWDYQLVDPVVFYLLRGMMARLNPEHMKVNLEARNEKARTKRKINQAVLNWELSEMNKTMLFYNLLFRGLLAGRSYISTGWHYEPAVKIVSDRNKSGFVMRDIVNRADAKNIRFQDMFLPNRNIPNIEEQPYIIERVSMRFGDMLDDNKNMKEEFWDEEILAELKKGKYFTNKIDYGVDLPEAEERQASLSKQDIWLRSQYLSLLRMQTKENDVIWTLENSNEDWILNKNRTNPYWHGHYPYLSFAPFPEDDEFFSMGIVQPVADLQIAISSALNQFLTNIRKLGNPMWLTGQEASQTPDWQFVNRPNGIIKVTGDISSVKQLETRDVSRSLISMRNELQTTFERTTGMSSLYASGVSSSGGSQINKTATGARVIDANIDINLQMLVSLFSSQLLSHLGEHFLELNAQYITEEQVIKISGSKGEEEFLSVIPEEITANFDVISNPDTVTKVTPVVRQATLINLKTLADKEDAVKINKKLLWKSLIDAYPEIDNISDLVIDPEDIAQKNINEILNGQEPEVKLDDEHKKLLTYVQKYLIDNGDKLDDQTLALFVKYIDNLNNYIKAANPNLFASQVSQEGEEQMMPITERGITQSAIQPINKQSGSQIANQLAIPQSLEDFG